MNWYLIITGIAILIFALMKTNKYNFNFNSFANQLGLSESTNNYSTNTGNGAFGKYQFTASTIDTVSNELQIDTTIDNFLATPNLQDSFYYQYVNDILNFIASKKLDTFLGKPIQGKKNNINTTINIYGLVAGGWLAGMGGLENYLLNNDDRFDGATYTSDYIAKFSKIFNTQV